MGYRGKRLGAVLGLLAGAALVSGTAWAGVKVITSSADFAAGVLDGAVIVNGQIQLGSVGSTFPVLWVSNAGEDSVSKIDTRTNKEVARYKTSFDSGLHGAYSGPAPSRTTVDTDGNVFVLNRHFDGRPAVLLKILASGGIDRNGNGVIDTSSDVNNNGQIDPSEVIQMVDANGDGRIDPGDIMDERVAWAVEVGVPGGIGRAACIGTDGHVWVGLYSQQAFYKVNSGTGAVMSGPHGVDWTPYGCAVDRNGILYSATLGSGYGRLDTNNPVDQRLVGIGGTYGIAIGNGKVYLGGNCAYYEVDAATEANVFRNGVCNSGLSVDINGDVVAGYQFAAKYSKVDGSEIWQNSTNPASYAVGVVADGDGHVWQVDFSNNRVTKFDGATGAFLAEVPVGSQPYTYSDATGIAARTQTTQTGFWSIELDAGANGAKWYKVCWDATVPAGGTASTESKASDTQGGLNNVNFQARANCAPLEQQGRFLLLRAKMQAGSDGSTPAFQKIAVLTKPCDVNNDGVVDKRDIALITAALNTNASGFADPRDADGNGRINVLDVRACTQQCTRAGCAIN